MSDGSFLINQVAHWINTPTNGYLGSDYGVDLKSLLQQPMSAFNADALIAKMRRDIPALNMVDETNLNIYMADEAIDGKVLYLEISGELYKLNDLSISKN